MARAALQGGVWTGESGGSVGPGLLVRRQSDVGHCTVNISRDH